MRARQKQKTEQQGVTAMERNGEQNMYGLVKVRKTCRTATSDSYL